eukprot:1282870-Alexandrium_andersonii.AAC.1
MELALLWRLCPLHRAPMRRLRPGLPALHPGEPPVTTTPASEALNSVAARAVCQLGALVAMHSALMAVDAPGSPTPLLLPRVCTVRWLWRLRDRGRLGQSSNALVLSRSN